MTPEYITAQLDYFRREILRFNFCTVWLQKLGEQLTEGRTSFSPSFYVQIDTTSREDLTVLLTMAPPGTIWRKEPGESSIRYRATIDGEPVTIVAKDSALPPTCKLVEEEYDIPGEPAKPATEATPPTKGKRIVLKCVTPELQAESPSAEVMPEEATEVAPQVPAEPDPALAPEAPVPPEAAAPELTVEEKKVHCSGCRDDFYNHGGRSTTGRCWMLDTAQLVQKKEVHVDQVPPWNQAAGTFLSCFRRLRHVYVQPHQTC